MSHCCLNHAKNEFTRKHPKPKRKKVLRVSTQRRFKVFIFSFPN